MVPVHEEYRMGQTLSQPLGSPENTHLSCTQSADCSLGDGDKHTVGQSPDSLDTLLCKQPSHQLAHVGDFQVPSKVFLA